MRDQHRPVEQWLRRNRFYNRLQWAGAALAVVLAVVACDIQRPLCFPKANEWRGRQVSPFLRRALSRRPEAPGAAR